MKIKELQEHCENCKIINFCAKAYKTPQLCTCEELKDIDEIDYKHITESITEEEINEKLRLYKENDYFPWYDNERKGAILDIVLEKLYKK